MLLMITINFSIVTCVLLIQNLSNRFKNLILLKMKCLD